MKRHNAFQETCVILSDAKRREGSGFKERFFSRRWRAQNDGNGSFLRPAQGFTLIELVMIILIAALLSVAVLHIMQFVVRNTFYLPNQVQADLVAAEALEILVEGDSVAKGLRFCKAVTTSSANQVVVMNQDDETITYSLSGGNLTRTVAPGTAGLIPYYKPASMTIAAAGTGGALFTYFDVSDALTAVPEDVRRIRIDLTAQNGTGNADSYEGISRQSTSVKVNKYA